MPGSEGEHEHQGWRVHPEDREALASLWELAITVLGFVFLVAFVAELTLELSAGWQRRLLLTQYGLWFVFATDFFVRLAVADDRLRFVRRNWLVALSVALPWFRVLRFARALRALRVVRVVTTGNRAMGALRKVAGFGGIAYVAGLSAVVLLLASAGVYSLERDAEGSTIESFGEAVWWASTTVLTLGSERHPATVEGRVLGVAVMIYGLGVSGYITAVMAVGLLGLRERGRVEPDGVLPEVRALRQEVEALRADLEAAEPDGR